jgi:hypothetical protein
MITQYIHPVTKKLVRVEFYGILFSGVDPLDRVAELNKKRATALDVDIRNLRSYISWLKGRVDTWKEQDLLPL